MLFRDTLIRGLVIVSLAGVAACSVEKNTSLSRNYHNLTSHYNIYFNGIEAFKKGINRAQTSVTNDFTQILPIFLYEVEDLHASLTPDMQRAIDKATKVITFHSITSKPKVKEGNQTPKDKAFFERNEYNKWVDDCYMLMGRAYMYQGEFFLAIETFKHVLITFPADEIRFLAMTWLARAYIMVGETREAERILMSVEGESELPEDYRWDLLTTRAQYEMYNESFGRAAEYLEQALGEKGIKKNDKIRYNYILAQLYEEAGQNDRALEKYRLVTRYNPPYEIAFNAKVSMAEVFESGEAGSEDLKKLLHKMLRDSKNREYLDQIYFALGNIAFEEGDKELAIEYYQKSVSSSVSNRYQKGYSSVTLAGIYYDEPDYIMSATYYDSAVSFLNKNYPGYTGLMTLSASLSNLVYSINSYELEDSVQVLAGMTEEERNSIIDGIIEQVRKDEEEARLAEQQAMQDMAYNQSMIYGNNMPGSTAAQAGGKWYFYNLNAKSFGQPEFRMKWGERKLEDNWRRKNKQTLSSMGIGADAESDSVNGGGGVAVFDNKSREYYLINIPLTDSARQESDRRLENALYNMGLIYKDNLLDYEEAILAFERLMSRYPESEYRPELLYHLYELYNNVQNSAKAEGEIKPDLVFNHPESHYAKLLSNPNYLKELEAEEMKVSRLYERIYGSYRENNYTGVISGADSALSLYPDDPLVPKFKLIRALSLGAAFGEDTMKVELDSLMARHPGTDESFMANDLVSYMYEEFPEIREAEEAKEAEQVYLFPDSSMVHYFLLAVDGSRDVNRVSFDLLNYNLDHFNQYDLDIGQIELDDGYQLLVVRTFNSLDGAERYMEVIRENSDQIVTDIPSTQYRMMVISEQNHTILTQQKVHNPYYLFYRKYYLNEE